MPITEEEKRWRAEEDARILAEAKVIQSDQQRLEAARAEAQRMADEKQKEAKAMRSVAGRKPANGSDVNSTEDIPGQRFNVFRKI
jgi:hypothetical protein